MKERTAHCPRQLDEKPTIRRVIRLPEVMRQIGLSKSEIHALMTRGLFPQSIKIGPRATGWFEDEVQHYLATRPRSGNDRKK